MSGSSIVGLVFIAIVLFAGPKEEFKYRLLIMAILLTIILFGLWASAPAKFEADIREMFE